MWYVILFGVVGLVLFVVFFSGGEEDDSEWDSEYGQALSKARWVETVVDGQQVTAKVYGSPSEYGIASGRVSFLGISSPKTEKYLYGKYLYDRRLLTDKVSPELLETVLGEVLSISDKQLAEVVKMFPDKC